MDNKMIWLNAEKMLNLFLDHISRYEPYNID